MPKQETGRSGSNEHPTRTPLLSWADQYRADIKSVQTNLDTAKGIFRDLLRRPLEKAREVKVVRDVKRLSLDGNVSQTEIEFNATSAEISSAPDAAKRLFLDLGIKEGEEIAVFVEVTKKDHWYSVVLSPTNHRVGLLGVEFNFANQLWFRRSGASTHGNEPALGEDSNPDVERVYDLLQNGLVHDSHEVGTHASYTEYDHWPHPYIAEMHKGVAEWILATVDARTK